MRVTGRASGARGGIGRVGGRGAAITAVTSGIGAMRWCMGWTRGRAAVVAPAGVLAAAAPITKKKSMSPLCSVWCIVFSGASLERVSL